MPAISLLREYVETLEAGAPPKPYSLVQRPDGQYVADVFPLGLEAMLFPGFKGHVWIQPGKAPMQHAMQVRLAQDLEVAHPHKTW